MEGTAICIVCKHPVELDKATDVGTDGEPAYVANTCLMAYFTWQELQSVPSYVEHRARIFAQEPIIAPIPIPMEDDLVHTDERPFCGDFTCMCHDDNTLFTERIFQPFQKGLISPQEMFRIHWNKHM